MELCPRCGADWRCTCPTADLVPQVPDRHCRHDWTPAVGVDLDPEIGEAGAAVVLCRLCGVFGVRGVESRG